MCPLQVFQAIFDGRDLGRSDAIYNVGFDSAHGTDYRARYQGVYKDPVAGESFADWQARMDAGLAAQASGAASGAKDNGAPGDKLGPPPTLSDVAGMAAQSQALLQARASGRQRSFLIDAAPFDVPGPQQQLDLTGEDGNSHVSQPGTIKPLPAPGESPAVAAQEPLTRTPAPLELGAGGAPSPGQVAAVQTGETPFERLQRVRRRGTVLGEEFPP